MGNGSDAGPQRPVRQRKRSEDRMADIIDAAEREIRSSGNLTLSINAISDALGVSRALVYAYFDDRNALLDAVLHRNLDRLDADGLNAASTSGDASERALACAVIYMRHVTTWGPVLHFIFRETPHSPVTLSAMSRRNAVLRRLAWSLRRDLALPLRDAILTVEMLTAIPEELGRLVDRGEINAAEGESVCRRLVSSALAALRPVRRAPA